ncbi:hypothetical protein PaecuDRAFT_4132 [Paenibacillus curdlanolyticus YK9]|jgi:hypothetical protein|uniref:Uncharacterized protein n=1 Tax=Paenibacillus curdlanolyticus YK9 TaxID=717606 RepID=E0IEP1_9BACL|nr:hypothetical protein [Paenibacillus curdlanolyticus]EFM09129.1 hypothetical protein PaecuDRAFT_4132 [Paenibacillus curdlanolyticus YK9]
MFTWNTADTALATGLPETFASAVDFDSAWDMTDLGDWLDVTDMFEIFE